MVLILCNCAPNESSALATSLVEEALAACVNVLPAITSYYRWDGELHEDAEHTLLIKTSSDRVDALRERLVELHSYSCPEVLVVPVDVDNSHAPYVHWVREMTRRQP